MDRKLPKYNWQSKIILPQNGEMKFKLDHDDDENEYKLITMPLYVRKSEINIKPETFKFGKTKCLCDITNRNSEQIEDTCKFTSEVYSPSNKIECFGKYPFLYKDVTTDTNSVNKQSEQKNNLAELNWYCQDFQTHKASYECSTSKLPPRQQVSNSNKPCLRDLVTNECEERVPPPSPCFLTNRAQQCLEEPYVKKPHLFELSECCKEFTKTYQQHFNDTSYQLYNENLHQAMARYEDFDMYQKYKNSISSKPVNGICRLQIPVLCGLHSTNQTRVDNDLQEPEIIYNQTNDRKGCDKILHPAAARDDIDMDPKTKPSHGLCCLQIPERCGLNSTNMKYENNKVQECAHLQITDNDTNDRKCCYNILQPIAARDKDIEMDPKTKPVHGLCCLQIPERCGLNSTNLKCENKVQQSAKLQITDNDTNQRKFCYDVEKFEYTNDTKYCYDVDKFEYDTPLCSGQNTCYAQQRLDSNSKISLQEISHDARDVRFTTTCCDYSSSLYKWKSTTATQIQNTCCMEYARRSFSQPIVHVSDAAVMQPSVESQVYKQPEVIQSEEKGQVVEAEITLLPIENPQTKVIHEDNQHSPQLSPKPSTNLEDHKDEIITDKTSSSSIAFQPVMKLNDSMTSSQKRYVKDAIDKTDKFRKIEQVGPREKHLPEDTKPTSKEVEEISSPPPPKTFGINCCKFTRYFHRGSKDVTEEKEAKMSKSEKFKKTMLRQIPLSPNCPPSDGKTDCKEVPQDDVSVQQSIETNKS